MSRLSERITDLSLESDLDAAIEEAIRTCGGDARVAVGALILGQRSLHEAYAQQISAGYVRRELHK
ncbi:hypothetical protein [Aureimonas sp. AU20]|uniref:hypothetical protein n=1 Tax=Aureimonas sp. AU20 TaxID=1349819 RepID=UPI00071EBC77|nr:hypothetical protein [Aureimonas sp. AU20]ALN75830.1 hypothetical protein M673_24055 [Aureimonas sp. AU20]